MLLSAFCLHILLLSLHGPNHEVGGVGRACDLAAPTLHRGIHCSDVLRCAPMWPRCENEHQGCSNQSCLGQLSHMFSACIATPIRQEAIFMPAICQMSLAFFEKSPENCRRTGVAVFLDLLEGNPPLPSERLPSMGFFDASTKRSFPKYEDKWITRGISIIQLYLGLLYRLRRRLKKTRTAWLANLQFTNHAALWGGQTIS